MDMLGARDATATIAVEDIDRARRFYEGTLA
jgi:catechol 2,3-dioxygenase-like lactoylglutathione lyase family enzyme